MKKLITYLMKQPILYKIIQTTLGAGIHQLAKSYLKKSIHNLSKVLDQGCGTGEYSLLFSNYTGLDNNPKDIDFAKNNYKGDFVIGSAAKMPFKNNSFDCVFAVGLHHHLTDVLAKKAMLEALRVIQKGGQVIIIDAILPKNPLNIIGLILRKLDRGGHVRSYKKSLNLLPKNLKYSYQILSIFPFDLIAVTFKKS